MSRQTRRQSAESNRESEPATRVMVQHDRHVRLWREAQHDAHVHRWCLHHRPAPPQVTPEIVDLVFREECWNLTQLIAWIGTKNPEAVAIGSQSFSPWVMFDLDNDADNKLRNEAEYALLAWVHGELDAPPEEEAQNDAHVRRWRRWRSALAEKNWKEWGREAEKKLTVGFLGLTVDGRPISAPECEKLSLITERFLLPPRLIWCDAARGSGNSGSRAAIRPLVSRELVIKEYPADAGHPVASGAVESLSGLVGKGDGGQSCADDLLDSADGRAPAAGEICPKPARFQSSEAPVQPDSHAIAPLKRGRRPQYEWEAPEAALLERYDRLGDHGDKHQDQDWNALERAMAFLESQFLEGNQPGQESLRQSANRVRAKYLTTRQ